jgi:hypothetical protein
MISFTETQPPSQGSECFLPLQPRPLARVPGFISLLPLLPKSPKAVHLPWELWSHILQFVVFDDNVDVTTLEMPIRREYLRKRAPLLRVCKGWLVCPWYCLRFS